MNKKKYNNTNLNMNSEFNTLAKHRARINMSVFKNHPTEEKPEPTENDYSNQFIERYFVKNITNMNSQIIEVDISQYKKFVKNPFYTTVKILWKISGLEYDIIQNKQILQTGAFETNVAQISESERIMKNIKNKLTNPLEFYKKIN